MQKITTCLLFDGQAEEAVNFYTSVFKNSSGGGSTHYDDTVAEQAKMPKGSVMTVSFELEGRKFLALNGGPAFKFNEAISLIVHCETQEEIDYYWEKLTSGGGEESVCGWLKDKFCLSWQIVSTMLEEVMGGGNPEGIKRWMTALMQMRKLDIKALKDAYEGK